MKIINRFRGLLLDSFLQAFDPLSSLSYDLFLVRVDPSEVYLVVTHPPRS